MIMNLKIKNTRKTQHKLRFDFILFISNFIFLRKKRRFVSSFFISVNILKLPIFFKIGSFFYMAVGMMNFRKFQINS